MSAYTKRKYVAQEVESFFELPEGKQIAKILRGQGNNLHLVETQDGEQFLASMPTKFRKYVWVKRGDFVVIEPIEEGVKVKAEIVQVILKSQIKSFKKEGTWPKRFCDEVQDEEEEEVGEDDNEEISDNNEENDQCNRDSSLNGLTLETKDEETKDEETKDEETNDQSQYSEEDSDDEELEENPNHGRRFFLSDEDDDDSDSDDEEDETKQERKDMPKNASDKSDINLKNHKNLLQGMESHQ